MTWKKVSIPQSGFGAFERHRTTLCVYGGLRFQSLSRDSGRLNVAGGADKLRRLLAFQSLSRDSGRLNSPTFIAVIPGASGGFNPSVGIRGV